ncbi:TetR/AcrR family transcriptional regulator [Streptomyces sp. LPB2020-019-1HS]|uniref:TetR/AcrR family transcriptional regulator n=1 Tax=Streptomyces sp. LPB2020-019-1HS TaxID=3409689 RepID=UPI003B671463
MGASRVGRQTELTPGAQRVLQAASRLFYERGIHAVGVDLIAAEAGVTKKTLYDRFGSKEQIVVEYLSRRDERWKEFLARRLDAAGPAPRERILSVFDAAREWAQDRSAKGCAMVNAHAEISDPEHPAHPVIVGQKQWMLALFEDLLAQAGAADPGPAARTLMLLHEGALVAHGLDVFADPVAHARRQAEAVLDTVLGPDGGGLR